MTDKELKEMIFSILISCQLSTYTSLYAPERAVVSIGNIVKNLDGVTRYRARKALKSLLADGLVCYSSQGCPAIESYGEYRELVCEAAPPINGYALTEKGFQSQEWKTAYRAWEKSMEEWAEM